MGLTARVKGIACGLVFRGAGGEGKHCVDNRNRQVSATGHLAVRTVVFVFQLKGELFLFLKRKVFGGISEEYAFADLEGDR